MQKKNAFLFGTLCAFSLLMAIPSFGKVTNVKADSVSDYINPNNWKNLPGYEYKTAGIPTEGEQLPATVTWPADENDIGINLDMKGYYSSGVGDAQGNGFAGLVYKNKIKLEDLSVTFTINSLGANSAAGDDGWISVCFLEKENMFSTTNPQINMGAIALLRTQTRSITVYDHEIGESEGGEKYSNFASGTSVSLDLDTYPACEGCTLRASYVKEATAAAEKYYFKIEQLDFETGEVLNAKTTSNPLIHSDDYAAKGKEGYFVFSSSTDNWEKNWNISIKNINGVDVGTKSDESPLTPEEKAEKVSGLNNSLQISTYCNTDGTLKEDGKTFYSPKNDKIDVNALVTEMSTLLYGFSSDDCQALADISREASAFPSPEAYVLYLSSACANIIDNYEDIEADILVEKINKTVAQLPPLNEVTLKNEQKVTNLINSLQVYYEAMKEKATEKYGGEAKKQKLWDEVIVAYSDKLDDIKLEKLIALVDEFPMSVTKDNLKKTIFDLVPAEMILEYFYAKIDDVRERKQAMYDAILLCEIDVKATRLEVDAFKETERVLVEDLEGAAEINYQIYYLSDEVTASDCDSIFEIITKYVMLSEDAKGYIDNVNKLFTAAGASLDAVIAELPTVDQLTKETYLKMGYDTAITNAYIKYSLLKNVSPETASGLKNKEKLLALVEKLDRILYPLGVNTIMSQTLDAKSTLVMNFVDMFTNYDGRNVEVTTNYGTVDMLNETVTIAISKNGEYMVEVKMTDKDYPETVTCSFKVTVTGAQDEPKKGGCGSSILASSILAVSVAMAGFAFISLKRKEQ